MSCFHKDIYIDLKQPHIGYTNITTRRMFEYLYAEYGEKTRKLQNKALADLEEEADLTGPSINHSLPSQAREATTFPFRYRTSDPNWNVHHNMSMRYQNIQLHQQVRPGMALETTRNAHCCHVLVFHQGSPQETTIETGTR